MIRTVLVTAIVAIAATGVVAQTDPIAARKELMKQNSTHTKIVGGMVKGAQPFDAKAVNAAFTQWADTAAKLPKAFPDSSKGGDTRALPKIWTDRAGFDAEIAAFASAAKARPKDIEELKTAFGAIGKSCGSCHEGYRAAAKK